MVTVPPTLPPAPVVHPEHVVPAFALWAIWVEPPERVMDEVEEMTSWPTVIPLNVMVPFAHTSAAAEHEPLFVAVPRTYTLPAMLEPQDPGVPDTQG